MWGPYVGRTGSVTGRIQRLAEMGCRRVAEPPPTGWPAHRPAGCDRDTVPVTMTPDIGVGERGVMGAPRSRHRRGSPEMIRHQSWRGDSSVASVTARRQRPLPDAQDHPHRGRPSRCATRRSRRAGGRPARAPIRGLQGDHRPCPDREGRPLPDRRRPVRLERPAAPLGRARRRRTQAPGRGPDPDGHHPGHPRLLRPGLDLPRLRPRRAGRPRARTTTSITVLDPDHPSVHLAALDLVVVGQVFATKRAPHSPLLGSADRRRTRPTLGRPDTGASA